MREEHKERLRKILEKRGAKSVYDLFSPELIEAMNAYQLQQSVKEVQEDMESGLEVCPYEESTKGELIAIITEQNETMLEYLDYASGLKVEMTELKQKLYKVHIQAVLKKIPKANAFKEAIADEFERYEEQYIPPRDAVRMVIRNISKLVKESER